MFGYLIFGRRPPALWIMIPIIISLISSIDFLKISGQWPFQACHLLIKSFVKLLSAKTWKICTGNVNRGSWRQFNWHTLESPPDLAGIFQLNFDLWCPQSRNGTGRRMFNISVFKAYTSGCIINVFHKIDFNKKKLGFYKMFIYSRDWPSSGCEASDEWWSGGGLALTSFIFSSQHTFLFTVIPATLACVF